jgi:hypothetical protein
VQLTGNWVWDCGHWLGGGERTELHPIRAFWVQRQGVSPRSATGEAEGDLVISTDGTPADASANCQHRTRGDRAAFKACLAADPGWQDPPPQVSPRSVREKPAVCANPRRPRNVDPFACPRVSAFGTFRHGHDLIAAQPRGLPVDVDHLEVVAILQVLFANGLEVGDRRAFRDSVARYRSARARRRTSSVPRRHPIKVRKSR